jgi:hypothetical protein
LIKKEIITYWEAAVLPLNYAAAGNPDIANLARRTKWVVAAFPKRGQAIVSPLIARSDAL